MVQTSEGAAIQNLFESDKSRFPIEGCRALVALRFKQDDLVPNLDVYFSTIAGYASSAATISTWAQERVERARDDLASSFLERYPDYEALFRDINDSTAPDLAWRLDLYEELRTKLLELIRRM